MYSIRAAANLPFFRAATIPMLLVTLGLLLLSCSSTAQPTPTVASKPATQPTAAPASQPTSAPAAQAPARATEEWPTKPINILVPFDAGGSVDRMARGLASHLTHELKVPITVENKPGASGQLGHSYVLQQPDDGYTLMVSPAAPYVINNILLTGAKFSVSDFAWVNAQWTDWTMVFTQKDKPWKTMGELIDDIKKNPGKISVGQLMGSPGHVAQVALLDALGIPQNSLRMVTYDGGGPQRTAAAGGQVDFTMTGGEGTETIKDMIRPLSVFLEQRHPDWDAPPINETLKPYGTQVPLISGAVRVLGAKATFKQKYPDRWNKLVQTYKATLDRDDYKKWLATNKMGGDWVGPDKTTQIIDETFGAMQKYKDLLKQ